MRSLLRIASLLTLLLATAAVTAFILVRQPSFGRSANLVTHRASASRLEHDVRWLTAEPRSADHPENLDRVANYLANEFARSGAVVTRVRLCGKRCGRERWTRGASVQPDNPIT